MTPGGPPSAEGVGGLTEIPGRNELARQCADLRDQVISMHTRIREREEVAAKWSLWLVRASMKLEDAGITDYEEMLTEADVLIDSVKDYAYDLGYRACLHDLTPRIGDVLEAFGREHLGPPLADPLAAKERP